MNRTLYFADKAVVFTSHPIADVDFSITSDGGEDISKAKIINFLETHNFIAIFTPQPEETFAAFVLQFKCVEAAGGIVKNAENESLMIHRNSRWDLPKGHREIGESIEQCAIREICEETGVSDAQITRPLCQTYHAYNLHGSWVVKRTYWYLMRAANQQPLTPQIEEGIDCVTWCSSKQVCQNLTTTYPTIRCVFAAAGY